MKLLNVVQQTYQALHGFWESRRTNHFLSGVLVSVFVLCMGVALANYLGWLPEGGLLGRLHFLQAVEISFTLLLFFCSAAIKPVMIKPLQTTACLI